MNVPHELEPTLVKQEHEITNNHFNIKDMGGYFIGLTAGNVIGDHLFLSELSDWSAAPRAAIAVSVMYGGSKLWHRLKD